MSHEEGIKAATKVMSEKIDPTYAFRPPVEEIIQAYLQAGGMVLVPREPTEKQKWDAVMRYRHDAGLLPKTDREDLVRKALWWQDAWVNSIDDPFKS